MRILLVSDFYPPVLGGMERVVEDLAIELVERGNEVSVATLSQDGRSSRRLQRTVRVHGLSSLSTRALARFYDSPERRFHPTVPDPLVVHDLRRVIRLESPQVVHANGWIMHSCVPAVWGSRAKLIVTLHDYGLACPKRTYLRDGEVCDGPGFPKCAGCAAEQYGLGKATALALGTELSQRTLYGSVDAYVAISQFVAQVNRRRLPAASRVDVIPSFISDRLLVAHPPAVAPPFAPAASGYLMYAGALERYKGLDVLLAAYERSRQSTPLLLVGPKRAALPPLPVGVSVAHDVTHEDVMAAWRQCSVAVVPSRWAEPLGLVALEAMACARPVIASDVGGLGDVVVDGQTGRLVAPGDIGALSAAINELLDDETMAASFGSAGIERARGFAASTIVPRIEALYDRVSSGWSAGETARSA